jgi:hypothetical protein
VAKHKQEQEHVAAVAEESIAVAEAPAVKPVKWSVAVMKNGDEANADNQHACEWGGHAVVVKGARDELEAWAVFCDSIGHHPSPKGGKVSKV